MNRSQTIITVTAVHLAYNKTITCTQIFIEHLEIVTPHTAHQIASGTVVAAGSVERVERTPSIL